MSSNRIALLIGTDEYTDPAFNRLHAPRADLTELAAVLEDPKIGDYRVQTLPNRPSYDVRVRINELFGQADRNDQLLLYFSGHGVKDEAGRLQLAMSDTRRSVLAATGVPADFIRDLIDHSQVRKVIVWLDCCYAGAFPAGMVPKAEGRVDVAAQLATRTGRGCAVMTASTAIQFAFEQGGSVEGAVHQSIFTQAIVDGLRTGDADLNADGEIDAAELYSYVHDRVKSLTPGQTPTRNDLVSGALYIAHSSRGMRLDPDLHPDIRQALRSEHPELREAAQIILRKLSFAGDEVALATLELLTEHPLVPPDPPAQGGVSELPVGPAEPAAGIRAPADLGIKTWGPVSWPVQPSKGEPPLTLFRGKRMIELEMSTIVDRFGAADGNLTYADGTPFPERSLVPEWENRPYHRYLLLRPLQVLTGTAIPWFDQPGGGTAYLLPESIEDLIARGALTELRVTGQP